MSIVSSVLKKGRKEISIMLYLLIFMFKIIVAFFMFRLLSHFYNDYDGIEDEVGSV